MKRIALAAVVLTACLDFSQGYRDCHDGGACTAGGAGGAGGSTAGGSGGGIGGGAAGGTAGSTAGGAGGGSAGGTAGGAGGGTAGGAAGGTAGGTASTEWSVLPGPSGAPRLTGVLAYADGGLIATGDTTYVYLYANNVWTAQEPVPLSGSGASLRGIIGQGSSVWVYATGGYIEERLNGGAWAEIGPDSSDYYAGWVSGDGGLWFAGKLENSSPARGTAIVRPSGRTSNSFDFGTALNGYEPVMSIMGVPGTDDVWGVITFGTVMRWSLGSQPQVQSVAALSSHMYGVWTNATTQFAVGEMGTAVTRTGGQWAGITTNTQAQLNAVAGTDENHLWFVGAGGTVLHWDGGSATPSTSGTLNDLNAISVLPDGRAWAVGASGTVIKFTP